MKIEKVKEFMKEKEKSRTFMQRVRYFLEIIRESNLRKKLTLKKKRDIWSDYIINLHDRISIWWVPFTIKDKKSPESIIEVEWILFSDDCDFMINLSSEFWYLPFYDEEYILFINEWEWKKYIQWRFLDYWIDWNKWFFEKSKLDELYELFRKWNKLYLWSDSSLQRSIYVAKYILMKDWLTEDDIERLKIKSSEKYEDSNFVLKILEEKFAF